VKHSVVETRFALFEQIMFYELESPVIDKYKRSEGFIDVEVLPLPSGHLQRLFWSTFEYPETSWLAFCVSVLSVMITIAAIVMLCMETIPRYSRSRCQGGVDPFYVGETVCTAWFTAEFLIRLASCPSKRSFFFDFKNVVDFVAVVPYYASLVLGSSRDTARESGHLVSMCDSSQSGRSSAAPDTSTSLTYLRAIRLVRVVRVLKLTKYCLGLQVTRILQWGACNRLAVS